MNQKGFVNIVLIILVVVLASALGYVILVKKPAPVEQPQSNNSQNAQPMTLPLSNNTVSQTPPTTQPNEMTNWSTYSNTTYKYQFNYPPDFEKYAETTEKVFFRKKFNQRVTFNVFVNPAVGFEGYDTYKTSKSVTVDGIASQIGFGKSSDGQLFIRTNVSKGGNSYLIYTFAYGDQVAIEKMFSDILSTFRFVN